MGSNDSLADLLNTKAKYEEAGIIHPGAIDISPNSLKALLEDHQFAVAINSSKQIERFFTGLPVYMFGMTLRPFDNSLLDRFGLRDRAGIEISSIKLRSLFEDQWFRSAYAEHYEGHSSFTGSFVLFGVRISVYHEPLVENNESELKIKE